MGSEAVTHSVLAASVSPGMQEGTHLCVSDDDSAADDAQVSVTPVPIPVRQVQHVKCLGWENLERPLNELSRACTRTLDSMGVSYTIAAASVDGYGYDTTRTSA